MIHRENNIDLATLSTLKIGGRGHEYVTVDGYGDLQQLHREGFFDNPWHIVGGGSDSVFSDDLEDVHFLRLVEMNTPEIISKEEDYTLVRIWGGANWDDIVAWSVQNNLAGIESLAAIPGTVGAAPIHNIGAYGSEFSDVCHEVRVFDTQTGEGAALSHEACQFEYRKSIFKQAAYAEHIVVYVTLKLFHATEKRTISIPAYKDVEKFFEEKKSTPTLREIYDAITEIRWGKLPRPELLPNCGSFFKNTIVPQNQADQWIGEHPDMPHFQLDDGNVKVPTGWLIESIGMKGYQVDGSLGKDGIAVYDKHALVIVNYGGATYGDLLSLVREIQTRVQNQFNVMIHPEVCMIDRDAVSND